MPGAFDTGLRSTGAQKVDLLARPHFGQQRRFIRHAVLEQAEQRRGKYLRLLRRRIVAAIGADFIEHALEHRQVAGVKHALLEMLIDHLTPHKGQEYDLRSQAPAAAS
jgi:hypothetical protein